MFVLSIVLATSVCAQATVPRSPTALYARYTPFACSSIAARQAAVATRDDKLAGRTLRPDTDVVQAARRARERHAKTVATLQACLARHTITGTPEPYLIGLGKTYLIVDDLARADSAFRRAIELGRSKPIVQRAWNLNLIVEAYADTARARLAKAMAYAAQLDAMGVPAAASRLTAHNTLYSIAMGLDSVPFMEEQILAAEGASRELSGEARRQWAWASVTTVQMRADLEGRRGNYAAAIAALERGADSLGPLRPGIRDRLRSSIMLQFGFYGKPAPKIQSMYVYAPGQPVSKAPAGWPTAGKPSLLVFVGHNCTEACVPLYALTLRIINQYASRGLDVKLVTKTEGVDRNRIVAKPEEESELIRAYFHDHLKILAPIAVWATTFVKDTVDGHQEVVPRNPNEEAYYASRVVLVDKAGIVRQIEPSGLRLQRMIEDLLK